MARPKIVDRNYFGADRHWFELLQKEFEQIKKMSIVRDTKFGKENWRLVLYSGTLQSKLGHCCFRRREIAIYVSTSYSIYDQLETLIHEIAHAIVGNENADNDKRKRSYHGKKWRNWTLALAAVRYKIDVLEFKKVRCRSIWKFDRRLGNFIRLANAGNIFLSATGRPIRLARWSSSKYPSVPEWRYG